MAGDIYNATGGYVAGAMALATAAGISTYILLTVLGVPFAVPLAVLMAFFDLIPLVGSTIGGVLVALVTLFADFPQDTLIWVAFVVIYQQFENSVLQPLVYRRAVNLHPLAVITAILIGVEPARGAGRARRDPDRRRDPDHAQGPLGQPPLVGPRRDRRAGGRHRGRRGAAARGRATASDAAPQTKT